MSGWNFNSQNLMNASFNSATMTGALFTNANIQGADFGSTTSKGLISDQIYSTASYQAKNLEAIGLTSDNLSGWNLAAQFLINANLNNDTFTGTDLTGADIRGANIGAVAGAVTSNLILNNGVVQGLALANGSVPFVVRNYHLQPGNSTSIPISVQQQMAIDGGATMRLLLEADAWRSTVSFASGIPVNLGGTLDLEFAGGVTPVSQIGRSFHLFDWNGVNPTGTFTIGGPYIWDISQLYTSGDVKLAGVTLTAGDFDRDGILGVADIGAMLTALSDLNSYKERRALSDAELLALGDVNGDHAITNSDIQALLTKLQGGGGAGTRAQNVPEPTAGVLAIVSVACVLAASVKSIRAQIPRRS